MNWMVKDSKGNKSATLTFACVGMVISSAALILSLFNTISIGSVSVSLGDVDSTLVLGYMAATVTAYVIRRGKSDELDSDEKNGIVR